MEKTATAGTALGGHAARQQAYDVESGDVSPMGIESETPAERRKFIRNVLGVLSIQLAVTFGIVACFVFIDALGDWSRRNPGVYLVALLLSFGFLIALACVRGQCVKHLRNVLLFPDTCLNSAICVYGWALGQFPSVGRSFPANYICLGCFTLLQGFLLGSVASRFEPFAVTVAVGMTIVVCTSLTLFAIQTKIDFTKYLGMGLVAIVVLILFGIIAAIMQSRILRLVYASLGVLIFGFLLVRDVQLIVGNEHRTYQFSKDDTIFAALTVYIDVVNMFRFLLMLVGGRQ